MAKNDRPTLAVDERPEHGSRTVRRLRREGWVPGVLYGGGEDCQSFKVNSRDLRAALHGAGAVIDLQIGGGKAVPVILKDQQLHPVRDEVMHVDMLQVDLLQKIHSTVPVELHGGEEAPGSKEGGVIEHVTRELNIEALPTDIPERIDVDVSGMEAQATMHLSEIQAPEGVVFLDDPEETIIATVTIPTEVEEPEIEEETELVGEDGEPIEGAEGETAAEGATGEEAAESGDSPGEES
jgi:large subunit ribosomal protein L25